VVRIGQNKGEIIGRQKGGGGGGKEKEELGQRKGEADVLRGIPIETGRWPKDEGGKRDIEGRKKRTE